MNRETILKQLMSETRHSLSGLMNHLQSNGLVSDEAIELDHVPDSDLLSALVRIQKKSYDRKAA